MRFAATVILYNPDEDVLENIETYCECMEKIYVVDNSDVNDGYDIKKKLKV